MREHSVLGQVALGYSPMVDRHRDIVATRLTLFPERPEAALDAAALLGALEAVWPRPATTPAGKPVRPLDPVAAGAKTPSVERPVALNIAGEGLLKAVLAARPPGQFLIEVPAFLAGDPSYADALMALHRAGSVLLIKGRPLKPLAPEVVACFSHSLVDAGEDRRHDSAAAPPAAGVRKVTTVQMGVSNPAQAEQAFHRGAVAILGWPLDEVVPQGGARRPVPADVTVVLDLIKGVEREEPASRLEAMLKREPTIAFRLMRYLNSPAFGLQVEINSFGHAVMLLGHQRLKRWLALLLASSSTHPGAKVTMHAAVRRGLFMEELARTQGDSEMAGEMFICGVFSLLDRLLRQPAAALLDGVPMPERVRLALLGEGGPYQPYLQLVQALEQEAVMEIREATERLMLQPLEVNAALLLALKSARQLD